MTATATYTHRLVVIDLTGDTQTDEDYATYDEAKADLFAYAEGEGMTVDFLNVSGGVYPLIENGRVVATAQVEEIA